MTYVTLRWLMLSLEGLVLLSLSYWIAARPSRATSRLGMRGKKRQQSRLRYPVWSYFEPLIRWMGVRMNGVLPAKFDRRLDTLLTQAGDYRGLTSDEFSGWMVLSSLATAVVVITWLIARGKGALTLGALPATLVLGGAIPYFIVDNARSERLREIERTLPSAIDLLALSMSAGLDFPGAVKQITERAPFPEAMRDELEYLLHQLNLGQTRAAVLREFAERAPIESVREFSQSVIQAEERGNPVAGILEVQASVARVRRTHAAEQAAELMQAKLVVPFLMLSIVPVVILSAAIKFAITDMMPKKH